jgi:hypothetical protein
MSHTSHLLSLADRMLLPYSAPELTMSSAMLPVCEELATLAAAHAVLFLRELQLEYGIAAPGPLDCMACDMNISNVKASRLHQPQF